MAIKVLICDNHALVRMGIRGALAEYPMIDLVADLPLGAAALEAIGELTPDVVLFGAGESEYEATSFLGSIGAAPGLRDGKSSHRPSVVMMVPKVDPVVLGAVRAGVHGVLLRSREIEQIVDAVLTVADGAGYLDPVVVRYLVDHLSGRSRPGDAGILRALTKREHQVLSLVAHGLSNEEIGRRLYVGEPTVKYHLSHVLKKLNLRDRLQVAAFAYKNNIVTW